MSDSLPPRIPDPRGCPRKLLDLTANAAVIVGIQRGLQGMYEGTGEDAEDAFASLERELGIRP
jgi:hypothetical protein